MLLQTAFTFLIVSLVGSVAALPPYQFSNNLMRRQSAPICRPPCEYDEECREYTDSSTGTTRDVCFSADS